MFDSRSEAEAARSRLCESQINPDSVRIVDQSASGGGGGSSQASGGGGFWSSVKEAFLPDEDRHAYEEGVRRGGYLVCARVDESQADQACQILEQSGSVDFDQRQQDWRSEGWQPGAAAGLGQGRGQGFAQGQERSSTVEEERIPIVEEELRVGKREVSRGGARVRSYVEETPVHEQVSLHEEHVSVERRPVNETLSRQDVDNGTLFQDREIEMTERAEEAVVGKTAHVREELVVRKTAEERTQNIDDTVRRTEVEVDDGRTQGQDRSAFGFNGDAGTARDPGTVRPEESEGQERREFLDDQNRH
jgi:uncharacterized protein (TIGR02271 family)